MRHSLVLSLLAALLLLLEAGCNQRPPGVDLIFINGAEPQSIDPAVITGQVEGRICRELFEGLLARNAKGEVIPGMAEMPEISADGKIYTFHIRPEARWSDGEPVTAHDFAASWQRVLLPQTAAEYAYILYFIKNAELFNHGKLNDFSQVGIKALDASTLEVELTAPAPFFGGLTAFPTYFPVPLRTIEKYGDAWIKPEHIVTNGPYLLKNWKINDRIELVKNPNYWRADQVRLRCVHALATNQASTAFNLYASGQADLILDKGLVPPMLMNELINRPDFHSYHYLGTYFYRFNCTKKPFDRMLVRKALAAAIDRKRIVNKITKAGESPATAFTPPGIPGYQPPSGIAYQPEQAQKWLAEAGYPGGKGFPRFSLLYNKSELHENIAVEIQDMWKNVLGIDVELRNQEWATYLNSLTRLDYDVARSSWIGDYNDPNTFLDCFVTGGGNNRTGWSNATYDKLIRRAGLEPDPAKRMTQLLEAEKLLVREELPMTPIYWYVGIVFYRSEKLGGLEPNILAEHPIREMFLKKEKN